MKGSRFSEEQIIGVLREHEAGAKTEEGRFNEGFSLWRSQNYHSAILDPTDRPVLFAKPVQFLACI